MIETLTDGCIAVVLERGDSYPGDNNRTVTSRLAVAFVTPDGSDGIVIEGLGPETYALLAGAAQQYASRAGFPAPAQIGAGGQAPAEVVQRQRRHDELTNMWDWNKPSDWNHHARADVLLDWATDPATPERDAKVYAALHAGEQQAAYLAQHAEEARETREELCGAVRELEDTTVTVYPGQAGKKWRDFLTSAKGWMR